MINTMLAEAQTDRNSYPLTSDPERSHLRISTTSQRKRRSQKKRGLFAGDWVTVAVLLACTFATCSVGVIYVAAFARIAWQAHNLTVIQHQLEFAESTHSALIQKQAELLSIHRIGPLAEKQAMAQDGASQFIDVVPQHILGQREVASAL